MVQFPYMSIEIDAIYDHGVFKPLVPPALPDQARVKLTVEPKPAESAASASPDFDAELEPLLFDGPNLPPDFSRADIYADHD
jgi:predicted DNA-binding antitoxin AbrB/MazE fold protein